MGCGDRHSPSKLWKAMHCTSLKQFNLSLFHHPRSTKTLQVSRFQACVSFPGFAWKCHFGGASIRNAAEAEPPALHSWLKAKNEKNEKKLGEFSSSQGMKERYESYGKREAGLYPASLFLNLIN
jgi:hypothetical protein